MKKSIKVSKNNEIIECVPVKKQKNKKIETPNITILENNLKKVNIKYVIHSADIHIRKREREEEYITVFDNWCEDIKSKNVNKNNSVIVLAGDILHDKTDLHPISVNLTKYLFISLCKITSVICIPGNHDVSLLNMNHNSIESIVKNLETENKLYLINNEGYYQYYNILFGHTRFGQSTKVLECKFNFDGYKCGLYHGIINGVKDNNIEYKNTNDEKKYHTTNDFSDYDFVFLGDIHKHSFLKKNIAYSGSLIQQTIDESLDKGYIFWDLEKGKGGFERVKNEYGKIKIEIDEDGQSYYDIKKLPKNLDVRIDCKSLDRKYIEDIYKNLNKNDIIVNKKIDLMVGFKNRDTKILIGGEEKNLNIIKNINDLSNLLVLKLKDYKKIEDKDIKSYKSIIDNLLKDYKFDDDETKKKITLLSLEFDNISIFGENNKIDFRKFKNIMGIVAPNSSGKSSFIDVIIYSIFEECTRGDRFDIININKNSLKTKIVLKINDVKYTITRTLTRNSKSSKDVKASVELYENDVNISGKDKKDTDDIIKKKIGEPYDFIITSIVTQKSLYQGKSIGFAELSSDKKRDILCKIARLDIYDNLFNDTSTKIRSLKSELTKYKGQLKKYKDFGIDIVNIRLNITKKKNDLNDKISNFEVKLEELNNELENYKKIKYQLSNYNFTNIKKIDINENNLKKINNLKNKISKLDDNIIDLKEDINNIGDIKQIELEYKNKKNKKIDKYTNDINELKKNIWNDTTFNYNNFDNKKNNKEIEKYIDEKNEIEKNVNDTDKKIKNINKDLQNKIKIVNKKDVDEYNKLSNEFDEIKNKKNKDMDELNDYKERLDNFTEHEYDPKCKYCMKNSITKEKLSLENSIELYEARISSYDKKLKILIKSLNKNKNITKEYETYLILIENKKTKENEKTILLKDIELLNEKLKNNKNKLDELNKRKDNYKKFIENEDINEKIYDIERKINTLQKEECDEKIKYDELTEEMIELTNNIEELKKDLIKEEDIYNQYNTQKDLYEKYNINIKNEQLINEINDNIENNNKELDKFKNEIIFINEYDVETNIIQKNINECNKIHDQYSIINDILKDGGLIESIMKDNLLPRFNEIVNRLFIKFGSRSVDIKYEKDKSEKKQHSINIYDSDRRNTNRDGGYQTFLNNLIYRIALSELNCNMKSNFIIIDEALDSADANNKQEMKKLITYLRSQHDWILIVSHDDDIKDTFDSIIEIQDNSSDKSKYITY